MDKEANKKRIVKSISLSIIAHIVSLAVAFVLHMIVPKFITEHEYAYWQTYMLYSTYVGILHFGLLDGIVLRYSQYDYEQLNKKTFRSMFYILLVADFICSATIIGVSSVAFSEQYFLVSVFVAIAVVTRNAVKYSMFTLQLSNRIRQYSFAAIIQKLIYGFFVVGVLLIHVKGFYWICIGEILGEIASFVWTTKFNKEIYFGKPEPFSIAWNEVKENISAGVFLLVSNWSAMFTIGATKMLIQWRWNELTFGKVAFAFSVTGLFLTFVSAISVVLFPALKRMKESDLPYIYEKIRKVLSPVLVSALIFYYPGAWLLDKWLPKYNVSVVYLGILLPIIIYRTRVSLLSNNYLKAYRRERTLLRINIVSVFIAILGGLLISYVFNNIEIMLIFTVLTFMCMSIMAETVVCKLIDKNFLKENIVEAFMTVAFFISVKYFPMLIGFVIYLTLLIFYLFVNRNSIIPNLKYLT